MPPLEENNWQNWSARNPGKNFLDWQAEMQALNEASGLGFQASNVWNSNRIGAGVDASTGMVLSPTVPTLPVVSGVIDSRQNRGPVVDTGNILDLLAAFSSSVDEDSRNAAIRAIEEEQNAARAELAKLDADRGWAVTAAGIDAAAKNAELDRYIGRIRANEAALQGLIDATGAATAGNITGRISDDAKLQALASIASAYGDPNISGDFLNTTASKIASDDKMAIGVGPVTGDAISIQKQLGDIADISRREAGDRATGRNNYLAALAEVAKTGTGAAKREAATELAREEKRTQTAREEAAQSYQDALSKAEQRRQYYAELLSSDEDSVLGRTAQEIYEERSAQTDAADELELKAEVLGETEGILENIRAGGSYAELEGYLASNPVKTRVLAEALSISTDVGSGTLSAKVFESIKATLQPGTK